MNKILLAYDGSEAAQKALQTTALLARLSDATVTVLGVVPPPPLTYWPVGLSEWNPEPEIAGALEEARRYLAELGIEAHVEEREGDAATTIEAVDKEGAFDTVVVGSRGLGALGRLSTRSVSEHVATHARGTVVIQR